MKCENIKDDYSGAVSGKVEITFSVDKAESDELQAALAIVEKYKKAAIAVMEHNPQLSEWHMISYKIKEGKLTVSIEDGMVG